MANSEDPGSTLFAYGILLETFVYEILGLLPYLDTLKHSTFKATKYWY